MTGFMAGNLAISVFNLTAILIIQICMAMRVPFPYWLENLYVVGVVYVLLMAIIWYSAYKIVEG